MFCEYVNSILNSFYFSLRNQPVGFLTYYISALVSLLNVKRHIVLVFQFKQNASYRFTELGLSMFHWDVESL